MKKLQFAMVNIVGFILLALILFLPLYTTNTPNNDIFYQKTIFGFHFLTGYFINGNDGLMHEFISSSWEAFSFVFSFITIVILNKVIKKEIGKDIINVVISLFVCLYFFFFQFNTDNYLTEYYGNINFETTWCFSLVCVLLSLYFIYFAYIFIAKLIKLKKENNVNKLMTEEAVKEQKEIQ